MTPPVINLADLGVGLWWSKLDSPQPTQLVKIARPPQAPCVSGCPRRRQRVVKRPTFRSEVVASSAAPIHNHALRKLSRLVQPQTARFQRS
jgi:hypothetical protein